MLANQTLTRPAAFFAVLFSLAFAGCSGADGHPRGGGGIGGAAGGGGLGGVAGSGGVGGIAGSGGAGGTAGGGGVGGIAGGGGAGGMAGGGGVGGIAGGGGAGGVAGGGGAGGSAGTGAVVSDDFDAETLDTGLWTVVDPQGDGTVTVVGAGSSDAQLLLSVPAGTAHDPWTDNNALRVMQPAADEDFELEVKFESQPTEQFQSQGLLVEQSAGEFIRFDVYSDGSALSVFSAIFGGGAPLTQLNTAITAAPTIYLRLARNGDEWTERYSYDGQSWTTATTFSHAMEVSSVGVFAGNFDPSPAHTAVVDYFFETSSPIDPEDTPLCLPGEQFTMAVSPTGPGTVLRNPDKSTFDCGEQVTLTAQPDLGALFLGWGGAHTGSTNPAILKIEADTTVTASFGLDASPPEISNTVVVRHETSAAVSWETDEPSTGFVEYGLTTAYELGSVASSTLATAHSVTLPGLTAGTGYHYRITAEDDFGNSDSTADATFATTQSGAGGPTIDVWYGAYQVFGKAGVPQRFVNVLGNVDDLDTVTYLAYSLDGGPEQPLTMGLNGSRLDYPGDFNVEIAYADLTPGVSEITIRAIDALGFSTSTTVEIDYTDGIVTPQPYSIDWASVTEVSDVAQIVDGKWSLGTDGLRTVEIGYDRLLAIGDLSWTSYEATVEVTLNAPVDPLAAPIIGLIMRWTGHFDWDGQQPRIGWHPFGALMAYAWVPDPYTGLMAWTSNGNTTMGIGTTPEPAVGVPQLFKMREDILPNGDVQYRIKTWPAAEAEPSTWGHSYTSSSAPASGSLVVVAHNTDITIGDVSIVPVSN